MYYISHYNKNNTNISIQNCDSEEPEFCIHRYKTQFENQKQNTLDEQILSAVDIQYEFETHKFMPRKWSKTKKKVISYSLPLTIFTYFSPETLLSLSRFNLQHTPHTLYNT